MDTNNTLAKQILFFVRHWDNRFKIVKITDYLSQFILLQFMETGITVGADIQTLLSVSVTLIKLLSKK